LLLDSNIGTLASTAFDLVIIGGGITGAGVAREASLAGLRVALLERDDFASGTIQPLEPACAWRRAVPRARPLSHWSSSPVASGDCCCNWRRTGATTRVHVARVSRRARGTVKVRAGLMLYDDGALPTTCVARVDECERVLAASRRCAHDALVGGVRYWDAATDDSRLTLASAIAAREEGAVGVNHVAVTGRCACGKQARGSPVSRGRPPHGRSVRRDGARRGQRHGAVERCNVALTGEAHGAQVLGSAGTHIAVPRSRLGNNDAVTIDSPVDGRVMFVLPAGPHAIIGTTEHPCASRPGRYPRHRTRRDVPAAHCEPALPDSKLVTDDVIAAWAGIRPLAVAHVHTGARARDTARAAHRAKHAITHRDDGLVSVTGGKLTTYRAMALDVLKHASQELTRVGSASATCAADHQQRKQDGKASWRGPRVTVRAMHDARETVHDAAVSERLTTAYGSRWRNVWSFAQRDPSLGRRLVEDLPYLLAEVPHAVEREMACTWLMCS
jgi:glycerol-3-phosphate dehydrogenase